MEFINKYKAYILFILIGIILISCQTSVRFASDKIPIDEKASIEKTKIDQNIDFDSYPKSKIIDIAESWIGVPYSYGGDSRNGVDCSAFVKLIYSEMGIELPRTSVQQYDYARKVDYDEKQIGDLIFFKNKNSVNHVGLYVGNNYMIHSSTSKGVIRQSLADPYYQKKYAGTGRIK